MLIGQYYTKINSKGRTALPVKFRKELGEKLIVCRWYENSLALFAQISWERVIDVAVGESLLISQTRDTERFLLGGAFEIEPDSQGRIVLPQALRIHAKLGEEVVFIGLKDRVEIWSKGLWEARDREITTGAGKLIEEVQKLKLKGARRQ